MNDPGYVFFLAHTGPDTARACELRDLLEPSIRVFLDAVELQPGGAWDLELPKHQRQSRATIALLSRHVEFAYYLREEIATAIALERHDPAGHRLIPVFLDGIPRDPSDIPYGMRVRHMLDAVVLGLRGVAEELARVAAGLAGEPPPPRLLRPPADRFALYDAMCRLNPSQFEEVLFRSEAPVVHLAPATMPLARRALDLIQWAENQHERQLQPLEAALLRIAPGALRGSHT
jgi:hypothetical protein